MSNTDLVRLGCACRIAQAAPYNSDTTIERLLSRVLLAILNRIPIVPWCRPVFGDSFTFAGLVAAAQMISSSLISQQLLSAFAVRTRATFQRQVFTQEVFLAGVRVLNARMSRERRNRRHAVTFNLALVISVQQKLTRLNGRRFESDQIAHLGTGDAVSSNDGYSEHKDSARRTGTEAVDAGRLKSIAERDVRDGAQTLYIQHIQPAA
jgi:hypothetical protein